MSHSVTIQTRTVTTGGPTALNTGFCKSWTGLLKVAQVIVGIVVVILELNAYRYHDTGDIFLMLMATTFMLGTAIFIISYIFSPVSEAIIGKTNYEIIYNTFALFLILIGAIFVVAQDQYRHFGGQLAAGYLSILLAILYAINVVFAVRNKV